MIVDYIIRSDEIKIAPLSSLCSFAELKLPRLSNTSNQRGVIMDLIPLRLKKKIYENRFISLILAPMIALVQNS
jgi:hypothetical protein